jgi:cytochrome c1
MIRARGSWYAAGWAAAVLVALWAAGCGKKAAETVPNTGGPPPGMGGPGGPGPNPQEVEAKLPGGAEFAAGKKVYADQGCARCHKLGDTGGRAGMVPGAGGPPGGMPPGKMGPPGGGMNGPDLTEVGKKPEHTTEWLAAHVRDPKAHKPNSRMPAYGPEKISDADMKALTAYLASRK